MGLAFFKLSVGMGTMMTYGSYFRDDQNIPMTAFRVMCADLFVSMLAGIAIFRQYLPLVFSRKRARHWCLSPFLPYSLKCRLVIC